MKLIALVALFGLFGAALMAEDTSGTCDPTLQIQQLEPLTQEEQVVLAQLQAVEDDPAVVEQAKQEAKVPLEAFGGC
ncbi:hypothetical protein JQT77_09300 [Sulfitobacter mediterraneus]|nr:hypothetical protein [Sulfitobacter mediterraneus]MBM1310358.1 hypothetical protein [Sulfitobacter mediterraneus]MBM1322602.1 hypothetical protein [Sulfitobacter mediterraneus]MBM1326514.1 hypothetical protein [Sulfitobacter mediterraneus]MBM1397860.1 hypothetical protein [Sulfitobacter mediterraneus]MBM1401745.1 hypothetical protein [Sulfitobacter mediterraneus]